MSGLIAFSTVKPSVPDVYLSEPALVSSNTHLPLSNTYVRPARS